MKLPIEARFVDKKNVIEELLFCKPIFGGNKGGARAMAGHYGRL